MTGPVRAAYDELIAAQELKPDPAQERAVAALDSLAGAIQKSGGLFSRLLGSNSKCRARTRLSRKSAARSATR